MAETSINSVQPSEISPEMVAYLLATSILGGANYGKGFSASGPGLPIITGCDEKTVLETYARCLRVVRRPDKVADILAGGAA